MFCNSGVLPVIVGASLTIYTIYSTSFSPRASPALLLPYFTAENNTDFSRTAVLEETSEVKAQIDTGTTLSV